MQISYWWTTILEGVVVLFLQKFLLENTRACMIDSLLRWKIRMENEVRKGSPLQRKSTSSSQENSSCKYTERFDYQSLPCWSRFRGEKWAKTDWRKLETRWYLKIWLLEWQRNILQAAKPCLHGQRPQEAYYSWKKKRNHTIKEYWPFSDNDIGATTFIRDVVTVEWPCKSLLSMYRIYYLIILLHRYWR